MEKQEYKNAIQTKKNICSAYLKLLSNKGKKINVTDIVKEANINRGTFYLHFDNIADVGLHIENELAKKFKQIETQFRQIEIDRNPEIIFDKFNEILNEDKEYFELIVKAGLAATLIEKVKSYILASISNNFKIMRYVTNYERFKLVVKYIIGGVIDTYIDWVTGKISCSLDDLRYTLGLLVKTGLKGIIAYEN